MLQRFENAAVYHITLVPPKPSNNFETDHKNFTHFSTLLVCVFVIHLLFIGKSLWYACAGHNHLCLWTHVVYTRVRTHNRPQPESADGRA